MKHFECREEVQQFKKACPEWHVVPDPEGPGWLCIPHFLPFQSWKEMTELRQYFARVGHRVKVQANSHLRRWEILGVI